MTCFLLTHARKEVHMDVSKLSKSEVKEVVHAYLNARARVLEFSCDDQVDMDTALTLTQSFLQYNKEREVKHGQV